MDRNSFEKDLLSGNVTERYLNMSKDELANFFGEDILATVNFGSQNNANHQYDLFEHILRTVDSIDTTGLSEQDILNLKIAAFFHDIGKASVATLNEKTGQTQFIGHAKKSAEIAGKILRDLGYDEQQMQEILLLIEHHDDFMPIENEEMANDTKRISKIIANISKKSDNYLPTISFFKKLARLCMADASAQKDVIEKNGDVVDTKQRRIKRLNDIVKNLPEAIVLAPNDEIEKLEQKKKSIIEGPMPIIKNGKTVNQKQIDLWNAMSLEEKDEKVREIDEQIARLQQEKSRLLEENKTAYPEGEIKLIPGIAGKGNQIN